jgi:hypothetical protein
MAAAPSAVSRQTAHVLQASAVVASCHQWCAAQAGALNDNLLPEAREDKSQPRKDAAADEQADELSEDEGLARQQQKQVRIYHEASNGKMAHASRYCQEDHDPSPEGDPGCYTISARFRLARR